MADLVKVLGKAIRAAHQNRPLKLDLTRLVSKQSLGFLLSGLKNTSLVQSLSLKDCALDDEDLDRIANRLIEERSIEELDLSDNAFSSVLPLISLLRVKSQQYHRLDLGAIPIQDHQSLSEITEALSSMRGLQKLGLQGCLQEQASYANPLIKSMLRAIVTNMSGLKELDLSRNSLSKDSLSPFLVALTQGTSSGRVGHVTTNLKGLQSLNLSYVNLHRDCVQLLVNVA